MQLNLGTLFISQGGVKTSNESSFLFEENKENDYQKVIRGRNIKAYRINYDSEFIWYRLDLMKKRQVTYHIQRNYF
jgi:hypothetical protein